MSEQIVVTHPELHMLVQVSLENGIGPHRCSCGEIRDNAELFAEHQDAQAMRKIREAALNGETITLLGRKVWPVEEDARGR